jgi:hypothetical protein
MRSKLISFQCTQSRFSVRWPRGKYVDALAKSLFLADCPARLDLRLCLREAISREKGPTRER